MYRRMEIKKKLKYNKHKNESNETFGILWKQFKQENSLQLMLILEQTEINNLIRNFKILEKQ